MHVARYPDALAMTKKILTQAVHGGVTSVRDMGGDVRVLAEIQPVGHMKLVSGQMLWPGLPIKTESP